MTSSTQPTGPRSRREQRRHELANTSLRDGLKPTRPIGAVACIGALLALLWIIVAIDAVLDHRLLRFGIKPRRLDGLPGLALSPFLHADVGQLAANTLPFLVLGWLVFIGNVRLFLVVTIVAAAFSGGVDWLLGPTNSVLVGVGGILFGWLGYLIGRAWYTRHLKFVAAAVLVLAVFSSMLNGLLPRLQSHVFWGGQVAALLAGGAVAAIAHRKRLAKRPRARVSDAQPPARPA